MAPQHEQYVVCLGRYCSRRTSTYVNKIVADPTLDSNGDVIFYAALGGSASTAGIWRSIDSGTTWTADVISDGEATDVTLDPVSGTGVLGGNLQIVYAAFPGLGVIESPNQGQSWFGLLGTTGDPLLQDVNSVAAIPVDPLGPAPTSSEGNGRILLAKPFPVTDPIQNQLYEGWLYALVDTGNNLDGLYVTKDYGQNWTKVDLSSATYTGITAANPTNDSADADYNVLNGFGNSAISFAIDPTNPNVVYIGGTSTGTQAGFIRVDITGMFDPHAFVDETDNQNDGGVLSVNASAPLTRANTSLPAYLLEPPVPPLTGVPTAGNFLNLLTDPQDKFAANATLLSQNVTQVNNTGADAKWFPVVANSPLLDGSSGQHAMVTFVDPLTGESRLILADNQGIYSGVDDNGTFNTGIGTAVAPLGSRNGNLALTQFYYGAVQPSAHLTSGTTVFAYGGAQNVGGPKSGDFLTTGTQQWTSTIGTVLGVATDPTGSGTTYQFVNPGQAGTNFFQVSINGAAFISRTFNLTTGPNRSPVVQCAAHVQ